MALRLPVIDVRSPGEFLQGHIPGAHNIPLFDNDERARVGTTYVKIGKEPAIELGKIIAGEKTDYYLNAIGNVAPDKQMLLHCWRGGMRSAKIAAFFAEAGYQVFVLEGGYKAYRGYIRKQFSSGRLLFLIGGYTGSGKTGILKEIGKLGHQIIDLEALACHKGSNFGHLGQNSQPTTEQFENNLYTLWSELDPIKPLWLEHESMNIGTVTLPDTFHAAMLQGTLFFIELPKDYRIKRLVDEYACFEKPVLQAVLEHLGQFMGTFQAREVLLALQNDDFEKVADIALTYYDKLYANSLVRRPVKEIVRIPLAAGSLKEHVEIILNHALGKKLMVNR
ncbi:MAG: tRNA 2-selenouridine(34) synthase MnmH [Bacteroidales bacterium]|nr:tRNA 2-selenouridine(34) synthase MnmH [Bacteroidales bacterium]